MAVTISDKCDRESEPDVDFACGGTGTEAEVVNDAGFLHTPVDDACLRTLFEIVQIAAPVNPAALLCIMRGHPRFPHWLFDGDLLIEGPKPREFYLTVLRYMLDSAHWETPAADGTDTEPQEVTECASRLVRVDITETQLLDVVWVPWVPLVDDGPDPMAITRSIARGS